MGDQYRALTRKYRPQRFDEIVSQKHVSSTLKNAIEQNRLSHAYMFSGPRGVGKTTMARVLAREVNEIDETVDGEALNQTLNVIEIDAASNNSVEDIRDLRERVRVPPQSGKYKIYIIDEVHMLSKSAFNAFLKTLEEPPDHVIFIFATTEPNKVLPTILSRVQRFDFKRLKVDEIVDHLHSISEQESIDIDDESLHVIAKKADGALRDALGLMDQAISFCGTDIKHDELLRALNVVSTDRLFELTKAVEEHDADRGMALIHEALREGYDIQEFLAELLEHLRNLYVARNSEQMYLVEASENTKNQYRENYGAFTRDDLMRMMHIVSEAQRKAKQAQQPRVQFEIAILKLIHMQRSQTLQHMIDGLQEIKKNFEFSEDHSPDQDPTVTANRTDSDEQSNPPPPDPSAGESDAATDTPAGTSVQDYNGIPDNEASDTNRSKEAGTSEATSKASSENIPQDSGAKEYRNYDFFGTSSLNKYKSSLDTGREKQDSATNTARSSRDEQKPAALNVADLKESWHKFVNQLEGEVPQLLHVQLERMEPMDLENRTVILQCDNPFAEKMIREHRKNITRRFSQFMGTGLRIDAKVVNRDTDNNQSKSPYERFKELQHKDPTIRTIVELFGAELEY